jgi:nucleolar complex protein 2
MNEDDQVLAWRIDSSSGEYDLHEFASPSLTSNLVYDKLVLTALRYTPVVLEHHVPYKTLPNGKL